MFIVSFFLIASVALTLQFGKHVSNHSLVMFLFFVLCYVLMHLLYLLVLYVLCLPCNRSKPIRRQRYIARLACMSVSSILCSYMGVRVSVRGQKQLPGVDRTFVMVSNHRSALDPLIVMDKLRVFNVSFVSKPENMNIPLVGTILHQAGFLSLDRDNDRKALETIRTAAEYVKKGFCSMGIYPEGTRNQGDELLPFHVGSFKLAQRANAPLVIACVRNTENPQKFFTDRTKTAFLDILEVLTPEQVKSMSTQQLCDYCRLRIQLCLYTPVDEDPTGPKPGSINMPEPEEDDYDDYDDYEDYEDETVPEETP